MADLEGGVKRVVVTYKHSRTQKNVLERVRHTASQSRPIPEHRVSRSGAKVVALKWDPEATDAFLTRNARAVAQSQFTI